MKLEVLHSVTFLVRRQLRLTCDQKVVFLPEDAERVTVVLGNGMYLETGVTGDTGWPLGGGTPEPGGPNPIEKWHIPPHAPPATERMTCGEPEPGFNDYKTLWKKQFVVRDETPRK